MSVSRRPIHGAPLLGLLLLGAATSAHAGAPLDIPVTAPSVVASMQQTHVNLKVTPNEDEKLAFSLALPKSWAYSKKFGPVPSGPLETRGLAFFASSTRPDAPVLAATLTSVPYEIALDGWALASFAREGWQVVSSRWVPGPHGLFFDVTGTRVVKGTEEVRRTSVRADGGNVFSLNALCGRSRWDEAKEIFWAAHMTFELLHEPKEQMETWMKARASGPDFQVAFPASWSAETEPSQGGGSGVHLRLAAGQTLLAYVRVTARPLAKGKPPPALEARKAAALAVMAKAGFTTSGPLQSLTEKNDPRSAAVRGWKGGFLVSGRLGQAEAVARLGFVDDDGLSFTLIGISPPLADDALVALRAQRAFEIARFTAGAPE